MRQRIAELRALDDVYHGDACMFRSLEAGDARSPGLWEAGC